MHTALLRYGLTVALLAGLNCGGTFLEAMPIFGNMPDAVLPPSPGTAQLIAVAASTSRSDIGRLGFIHPALPSDDPFFSQMIEKIAEVQGVRCSRSEAFGWRLPAGDQKALDDIVGAGMDALQVRGYTTQRLELPVQGVLAFDAHSGDPTAEDPRLIVAWQLSASDVHLVLCRVKEG